MKKGSLILHFCLTLLFCVFSPVFAEEIPEEAAISVSENLENIFPFEALKIQFEQKAAPVWGDIGTAAMYETNTQSGTRNLLLFSNANLDSYSTFTENPNIGLLTDFSYEMDITLNDVYPQGEGGCYIGYMTEKGSSAVSEPLTKVMLYFSKGVSFQVWESDGDRMLLTAQGEPAKTSGRSVHLKIVRLTNGTLFYADDVLVGSCQDQRSGPFRLMYGIELSPVGEVSECSLDNLVVRKVAR